MLWQNATAYVMPLENPLNTSGLGEVNNRDYDNFKDPPSAESKYIKALVNTLSRGGVIQLNSKSATVFMQLWVLHYHNVMDWDSMEINLKTTLLTGIMT